MVACSFNDWELLSVVNWLPREEDNVVLTRGSIEECIIRRRVVCGLVS